MAMTTERYWANFRILRRVYSIDLQRPYIRSGYFSDIDTLLLREAISVPGVKIAAIESRAICTGGRRAAVHIERRCGNIPRNMVAHKPSSIVAHNRITANIPKECTGDKHTANKVFFALFLQMHRDARNP